ncbi:MAG TPA: choice-of-anchor J domain-containing protein [Chitinophagaceae bacterium]|jgi:hypothetical protein|nr:choice-of-anchor J domain-containing protein [Chitinophagaceae bacterium]
MKKKYFLLALSFGGLTIGMINGCKKDSPVNITHIGTTIPFTEEFTDFYGLSGKGWVVKDNTGLNNSNAYAQWDQGLFGYDKGGVWYGFTAYSYTNFEGEFAYSSLSAEQATQSISSWLITPVLSVKNGDKISFYARGDTTGVFTDRMQVLMNKSSSSNVGNSITSTGSFNTVLLDINSTQAPGGFPTTWTKYEYSFSGISGNIDTRIAFRHFVKNPGNARGVGIDQFKFEVN